MATSVSGTSFVNGKVEDMARVLMMDKRVEAILEYGVLNCSLLKSLNMHLTMEEKSLMSNVEMRTRRLGIPEIVSHVM
jgi:hypothetical protein